MSDDFIEGELEEQAGTELAPTDDRAVVTFNPLDAEPVTFKKQLAQRQANYDNLASHLQVILVAGKDFGKIHVAKNCDNKWHCTNPGHFSGWELFAPGADKILGVLNLGCHYPDIGNYREAALRGVSIAEVITDCQILGHAGQVISEGVGACARDEPMINNRNLNATLKRACKRARLDAVKRLPAVSALFQDDEYMATIERQAGSEARTAAKRAQTVSNKWDTGATLEVCPIGNEIKGKPWREIETGALEWLVAHVTDKPDILRAAAAELSKRDSATGSGSIRTPSSPTSGEEDILDG